MRGVAPSSSPATPGPTEPTSPSKPNGPPDTVKNITATRGPRRRADGRRVTGACDRAQRPATERATSAAVAAAASLVMGGNLMITMFDVAVVGTGPAAAPAVRASARAPLDVPAGGSATGRGHHRRLHGSADVPRIGGWLRRR